MNKPLSITACTLILLAGCDQESTHKYLGKNESPVAPTISYVPILASDDEAGPFSIVRLDTTNLLGYQARSGTMNLMEAVTDHPDLMGYIVINKVYSFGPDRYVLIVSTGESGLSCPATTYAISFDTKREYVDGVTGIDGCAETLDSLAEGNKLTIKKDGEATVIYNGVIK